MDRLNRKKHEYLRRVRRSLVCPRREQARLLSTARRAVDAFLEENPEADENDWETGLGSPEEFASELLSACTPKDLAQAVKRRIFLIRTAIVILLLCAAAVLLWSQYISTPPVPLPEPSVFIPDLHLGGT